MPEYNGQTCRGMCERLGRTCIRPELYAQAAADLGAQVQERSYLNPKTGARANFNVLYIPPQTIGYRIAVTSALAEMRRNPRYRNAPIGHLLGEAPCHLSCGITVCHLCGKQHARFDQDGNDYCPYQSDTEINERVQPEHAWDSRDRRGAVIRYSSQ